MWTGERPGHTSGGRDRRSASCFFDRLVLESRRARNRRKEVQQLCTRKTAERRDSASELFWQKAVHTCVHTTRHRGCVCCSLLSLVPRVANTKCAFLPLPAVPGRLSSMKKVESLTGAARALPWVQHSMCLIVVGETTCFCIVQLKCIITTTTLVAHTLGQSAPLRRLSSRRSLATRSSLRFSAI